MKMRKTHMQITFKMLWERSRKQKKKVYPYL